MPYPPHTITCELSCCTSCVGGWVEGLPGRAVGLLAFFQKADGVVVAEWWGLMVKRAEYRRLSGENEAVSRDPTRRNHSISPVILTLEYGYQ